MRGLTAKLRNLEIGEQIETTSARDNIYKFARKVGIKVTVEKFVGGFLVTRIPENGLSGHIAASGPPLTSVPRDEDAKQATLRALRALMNGEPQPVPQTVDEPEDWIEDPPTFENGEILYWHHRPKEKPVCYKRESDLSGC